jgi:hypothetical protein
MSGRLFAPATPFIGGGWKSSDCSFRFRPKNGKILIKAVREPLGHYQRQIPGSSQPALEPKGFVRDHKTVRGNKFGSQAADVESQARGVSALLLSDKIQVFRHSVAEERMSLEHFSQIQARLEIGPVEIPVIVPADRRGTRRFLGGAPCRAVLSPTPGCARDKDDAPGFRHSMHIGECLKPLRIVFETLAADREIEASVRERDLVTRGHDVDVLSFAQVDTDVVAAGEERPDRPVHVVRADFQNRESLPVAGQVQRRDFDESKLLIMRHAIPIIFPGPSSSRAR